MSEKQYDYGLLQYNGTNDNKIVANSILEDTTPTLLQYLIRNNISVVHEIPDRWGVYCVRDEQETVYMVYTVSFDKESGIYIKEYQYSLQWINILATSLNDTEKEKYHV
jgi:hypothetical protein